MIPQREASAQSQLSPAPSGRPALLPYVPLPVLAAAAAAGRSSPWQHTLHGTLLVADVAGFTALADRVAARGRLGAEQLVAILNRYYARVLAPVYRRGGAPFRFGGDSLVAWFAGEGHAHGAAMAALDIHRALAATGRLPAAAGGGRLSVSAGIASGAVTMLAAAPANGTALYLLLGSVVAAAVRAQDAAVAGETLLDASVVELLPRSASGDARGAWRALSGEPPVEAPPRLPRRATAARFDQFAAAFVHPALAARIGSRPPREPDGEHRRIAALFVQVDGLHALASGDGNLGLVESVVEAVAAAAGAHDGIVLGADPTPLGTKVLIVFGLHRAGEDDIERTALAALELRRALRTLPPEIVWRAGLNAGMVFAGDLGAPRRRDYTVLGDVVNVAARLAAGAEPGQIVAHAALEAALRTVLRVQPLPPATAKGKAEPLPRVALAERRAGPAARPAAALSSLIGRDDELAQLQALAATARQDCTTRALLLTGPPGIGKSALLGAVGAAWEESGGVLLTTQARGPGDTRPYAAWLAPLRRLLGIAAGDSHAAQRERLIAALRRWQLDAPAETAAMIGRIIGVPFPGSAAALDDPALLRSRLHAAAGALLTGAARERPLAIALDDLHRAGDAARELLAALMRERPAAPLLLLAASRGDVQDAVWDARLSLGGLGEDALAAFMRTTLRCGRIDERVLAYLRVRTGGNPLFAATLARAALAAGAIAVLPGTLACVPVADLAALPAPESLQALLLAAVDALEERDRRLVQAAAVCGQRFTPAMLRDAIAGPAARLPVEAALDRLRALGLFEDVGQGWLVFARPLLREAVYESLPAARRRLLHRRLGDALAGPLSSEADDDLLAYHFQQTGDPRLVPCALRLGARARELADGEGALRSYRAVADGPRRVQAHEPTATLAALVAAGEVLVHFVSRYAEALVVYARALRLARRLGVIDGETGVASICYRTGYALRRLGRAAAALRWLRRAVKLCGGAASSQKAEALLETASIFYLRGRSSRALDLCDEALVVARAAGAEAEVARCLDNRGTVLSGVGRMAEAAADLTESVAISARIGNRAAEAKAQVNLGAVWFWLARWDDAAYAYRRAGALRREEGDRDRTAQAELNLGEVLAMQGEFDQAMRLFAECRAVWERSGYAIGVANAHLFAGQALARQGDFEPAILELASAATEFGDLRLHGLRAHALATLAETLADAARTDDARSAAVKALELAEAVRSKLYVAYALRAGGVTCADPARGVALLRDAIEAFEGQSMRYDAAIARLRLAQRLAAAPRDPRLSDLARTEAETARGVLAELGALPDARRAEALLSALRTASDDAARETDLGELSGSPASRPGRSRSSGP